MTRKSPRAADEHRNEQGQLEEPNPPFAVQHQNSPGLEAKLDPQPRYEAEAYKAADKLKNKVALRRSSFSNTKRRKTTVKSKVIVSHTLKL